MDGFNCFSIYSKILNKIGNTYNVPYFFYKIKYNFLLKKLDSVFENSDKNVSSLRSYKKNYNFHVWIMWWQGYEDAPEIVKANYRRLKRMFGNQVIFLTKKNTEVFTDINHDLWKKLNNGIIDFTHWSDIVRFNVLKNNGGLWVDSTVMVSPKAKPYIISQKDHFFSINSLDKKYISNGRWIIGFIGGSPHESVFEFLDKFYVEYYKRYSNVVDYFLTDDAIAYYALKHKGFKKQIMSYQGEWAPYYFADNCGDKNIERYQRLFFNEVKYSIQIFRYKNSHYGEGSLYYWMINS